MAAMRKDAIVVSKPVETLAEIGGSCRIERQITTGHASASQLHDM